MSALEGLQPGVYADHSTVESTSGKDGRSST